MIVKGLGGQARPKSLIVNDLGKSCTSTAPTFVKQNMQLFYCTIPSAHVIAQDVNSARIVQLSCYIGELTILAIYAHKVLADEILATIALMGLLNLGNDNVTACRSRKHQALFLDQVHYS